MAARLKDDTTKYDYTPSFRYVASRFRNAARFGINKSR